MLDPIVEEVCKVQEEHNQETMMQTGNPETRRFNNPELFC
jgi:hypothetical protein